MSIFILQIFSLVCGVWFTYIGVRTLVSKKYYVKDVEHNNEDQSVEQVYRKIPRERIMFTRYGFGLQWLSIGLGLCALFLYSLIQLK